MSAAFELRMATNSSMRALSRQMQRHLEIGSSGARRSFSSSMARQQPAGGALDDLITGDSPLSPPPPSSSSSSSSLPAFRKNATASTSNPSYASSNSIFSSRSPAGSAPYRLHAHCTKHNTILSLTRDLPAAIDMDGPSAARRALGAAREGRGFASDLATEVDPKTYGQTVARTSCGAVGFKKAQRSTFEATTRTANRMFDMIEKMGSVERKNKHGSKIQDPQVNTLELVLKGYGPGREALIAALQTSAGDYTRRCVKRITDATPIKIGGTREKKRRKLSPPLYLPRKR